MLKIGRYNELEILRFTSVGAYLGDEEGNDILLPNKYLEHNMDVGSTLSVFVYNDSEDRPVATTETPKIFLNTFAYLDVKAVNDFGAFMDWGLEKDLLVPFKEQGVKMKENGTYLVYMYLDTDTNRLVATAKINRHLSKEIEELEVGSEVSILICEATDLGRKTIVNNKYAGLIFNNYISKPLKQGTIEIGYVLNIRDDGKLDISLDKIGYEKFDDNTQIIMDYLNANNRRMFLTDKSDPEEIRAMLNMSKKSFKKAIGNLYKAKKVTFGENTVELI